MNLKKYLPLLLIVFLASFLRFYHVDMLPPALNWDEVSHGYNAYSLLTSGQDEWGKTFPVLFRAYGDYKLPVYIYLTAGSEFLLGLTPLAVRLVSILAGIGSVAAIYFLARKLLPNQPVSGLLTAFLLAISPWGLFLSRPALEGNLALFLVLLGITLLLYRRLTAGFVLLALSMQTYYVARFFVPVFLLGWIVFYEGRYRFREILRRSRLGLAVLFISGVVVLYQMTLGSGSARYQLISLIDPGTIYQIGAWRSAIPLRGPFPRLIVNKVTVGAWIFGTNYLRYWDPSYLFLTGGTNYQFSLPGYGLLYVIDLPFLLYGIFLLATVIRRKQPMTFRLIVFWLAVAPVAASLTRDAPHPLRSLIMLPGLLLVTAFGLSGIFDKIHQWKADWVKPLAGGLIAVHGIFLFQFWGMYSGTYRNAYSWSWQYGYKEAVDQMKIFYPEVNRIIVTKKYGEPHEFVLWYWPWQPKAYISDPNLNRYYLSDWYWVDSFDKFFFVNDWEMKTRGSQLVIPGKTLVVTSPGSYTGGSLIRRINFLDGKPAFDVVKI